MKKTHLVTSVLLFAGVLLLISKFSIISTADSNSAILDPPTIPSFPLHCFFPNETQSPYLFIQGEIRGFVSFSNNTTMRLLSNTKIKEDQECFQRITQNRREKKTKEILTKYYSYPSITVENFSEGYCHSDKLLRGYLWGKKIALQWDNLSEFNKGRVKRREGVSYFNPTNSFLEPLEEVRIQFPEKNKVVWIGLVRNTKSETTFIRIDILPLNETPPLWIG